MGPCAAVHCDSDKLPVQPFNFKSPTTSLRQSSLRIRRGLRIRFTFNRYNYHYLLTGELAAGPGNRFRKHTELPTRVLWLGPGVSSAANDLPSLYGNVVANRSAHCSAGKVFDSRAQAAIEERAPHAIPL